MRLRLVLPVLAGALIASVLTVTPASAAGDLTVVQLAVGQNDAALFRGPCGDTALIDAGVGAADDITEQLTAWGSTGLAWAATTHYDADHIGDVADLAVEVPVVYDRGGGAAAKATATYDAYYAYAEARQHVPVDIGAVLLLCPGADQVSFTVLSAGTDGTAADGLSVTEENDRGLCFLGEFGEFGEFVETWAQCGGKGAICSKKGVKAIVVSRWTPASRSPRSRKSAYSGAPCATTRTRPGLRATTSDTSPGARDRGPGDRLNPTWPPRAPGLGGAASKQGRGADRGGRSHRPGRAP